MGRSVGGAVIVLHPHPERPVQHFLRSPRGRVDYEFERSIKTIILANDTVPLASCEFVRIQMAAPVAIGAEQYSTRSNE